MFMGEFPSVDEVRRGRPFAGRAGRELTRHLGYPVPRARDTIYLTNFSKAFAKDAKSSVFSDQDERELYAELGAVRPQTIVTLGARVTRYFLGDVDLDTVHGIPHRMPARDWTKIAQTFGDFEWLREVVFIPTYNPAAALRIPALQTALMRDMTAVGLYLRGSLPPAPVDDLPQEYTLL
jgi:DNA polymerase